MTLEEREREYANKFIDGVLEIGLNKKKLLMLLLLLLSESEDVAETKRTIESWGKEAKEKWNNGTNYVESLREADNRFMATMSKEIDQLIALGVTVWEASEYLGQRYYSTRVHDLSRIMVSEGTRILAEQEIKRGTDYVYHCVVDSRTCPECLALDGKVFKSVNAVIGENLPPMHPWCRCWVEAWTN